eukprot:Skav220259  [mRNA]  locus=scaffold1696:422156:429340:+ [translate_table: standard]
MPRGESNYGNEQWYRDNTCVRSNNATSVAVAFSQHLAFREWSGAECSKGDTSTRQPYRPAARQLGRTRRRFRGIGRLGSILRLSEPPLYKPSSLQPFSSVPPPQAPPVVGAAVTDPDMTQINQLVQEAAQAMIMLPIQQGGTGGQPLNAQQLQQLEVYAQKQIECQARLREVYAQVPSKVSSPVTQAQHPQVLQAPCVQAPCQQSSDALSVHSSPGHRLPRLPEQYQMSPPGQRQPKIAKQDQGDVHIQPSRQDESQASSSPTSPVPVPTEIATDDELDKLGCVHTPSSEMLLTPKIVINLESQLQWTLKEQAMEASSHMYAALCQPWTSDSVNWTLDFVSMLPDLRAGLRDYMTCFPLWSFEHVRHFHVYVDGSSYQPNRQAHSEDRAGWAFVVVAESGELHHSNFCFFCAAYGPLTAGNVPADLDASLGEVLHDALSAEAVGMLWAMAWLAQNPHKAMTTFYYDNSTVGLCASGHGIWNATWEYVKLHDALCSIRHCLRAAGVSFDHVHQKSHVEHPWSDLVDATAKDILPPLRFPSEVVKILRSPSFQYAWMSLHDSSSIPRAGALAGSFRAEGPFGTYPVDLTWNHDSTVAVESTVRLHLVAATANVLTSQCGPQRQQESGLLVEGRIASLQAQFHQAGCLMIGLQECRTKGPYTRHSSSHFVFQSGSTIDGSRGCEFWADRTLAYAVDDTHRYTFERCPQPIAQLCAQQPRSLIKFGKRASKIFRAYGQLWKVFRQFQKDFEKDCMHYGIMSTQLDSAPQQGELYRCTICDAVFPFFKALPSHGYQKHQLANLVQHFTCSNTCRACLKTYDSRRQVVNHLKYRHTGCMLKLMLSVPPLSTEEVEQAQQECAQHQPQQRRQQRRSRLYWPVQRAQGPLLPWPWQRHKQYETPDTRSHAPLSDEDFEQWATQVLFHSYSNDVSDILNLLPQHPYHGALASRLVQWFALHRELHHQDSDAVENHLAFQEAVSLWQANSLQELVNACLPVPSQLVQDCMISLNPERLAEEDTPIAANTIERRFQHLDSLWEEFHIPDQLRNRIQQERKTYRHFAVHISALPCSKPIFLYVLLLDLALSDDHDVGKDTLVSTMVSWIHQHVIAGILLAPPCETWTEARFNRVHDTDPRPLRSALHLIALPCLKVKEIEQLGVSNLLLYVSLRLLFHAAMCTTPCVMEHPAEPTRPERPSIWKLPWTEQLEQQERTTRIRIFQAHYGAVSLKPTDLAFTHLPGFRQKLFEERQTIDWKNLITLCGKNESNQWKTSQAKEYLAKLNYVLAATFVDERARRLGSHSNSAPLPSEVQQQYDELFAGDEDFDHQQMRPDFGGHFRSKDILSMD